MRFSFFFKSFNTYIVCFMNIFDLKYYVYAKFSVFRSENYHGKTFKFWLLTVLTVLKTVRSLKKLMNILKKLRTL